MRWRGRSRSSHDVVLHTPAPGPVTVTPADPETLLAPVPATHLTTGLVPPPPDGSQHLVPRPPDPPVGVELADGELADGVDGVVDDLPIAETVLRPISVPPVVPAVVSSVPAAEPDREPSHHGWVLRSPNGAAHEVAGEVVIGRAPDASRWPEATLLAVDDPTGSVSATHALVTPWESTLWVEDLESTHGVLVRREGQEWPVEPGSRARLEDGDVLALGAFLVAVHGPSTT